MLEARDRVGGRVHSYRGDFACPVDLGASIITGTEVRNGSAVCMLAGPGPSYEDLLGAWLFGCS